MSNHSDSLSEAETVSLPFELSKAAEEPHSGLFEGFDPVALFRAGAAESGLPDNFPFKPQIYSNLEVLTDPKEAASAMDALKTMAKYAMPGCALKCVFEAAVKTRDLSDEVRQIARTGLNYASAHDAPDASGAVA